MNALRLCISALDVSDSDDKALEFLLAHRDRLRQGRQRAGKAGAASGPPSDRLSRLSQRYLNRGRLRLPGRCRCFRGPDTHSHLGEGNHDGIEQVVVDVRTHELEHIAGGSRPALLDVRQEDDQPAASRSTPLRANSTS